LVAENALLGPLPGVELPLIAVASKSPQILSNGKVTSVVHRLKKAGTPVAFLIYGAIAVC
jgi:hypothetical protein